jgi:glutamate-1-semialdehyde 2,1-aminomutase
MELRRSREYLGKAEHLIPALSQTFSKAPYSFVQGVYPVYLERGEGSHVYDVDGNNYIDYLLGLGPILLGYRHPSVDNAVKKQLESGITFSMPHPLELEVAEELSKIIPCAEMTKYTKTGSDAVTAAIRAARAITERDHIAYCGGGGVWHDWYITITSRNRGIPSFNRDLISTFEYNNIDSLKKIFEDHRNKVAAVCIEPTVFSPPKEDFLGQVKKLASENGAILIFDEVVTGFRFALGGGQEYFGVIPDIAAVGKGMANGMPLGAIVGKRDFMKVFDDVFYSTTYAGETLSLVACAATINEIKTKKVIEQIWGTGRMLMDGFNKLAKEVGVNAGCVGYPIRMKIECRDEDGKDSYLLKSLFLQETIRRGVLFHPGITYISYSHTKEDVQKTLEACHESLRILKKGIAEKNVKSLLKGEVAKTVFK